MRFPLVAVLLFAVSACAAPAPPGPDVEDTGRLVVEDLAPEAWVEPGAPTALWVGWTSEVSGPSWVEYQVLGEEVRTTPVVDEGSLEHKVLVAGLPPDADVCFRAVTEQGGVLHTGTGCARTLTWTVPVPSGVVMPDSRADALPGYLLLSFTGSAAGVALVDRLGRMVWFWPTTQSDPMEAEPARAGGLWSAASAIPWSTMAGRLEHLRLGAPCESFVAPGIHHALTGLRDGRVAWLTADIRDWTDGTGETWAVAGDAVMVWAPDGTTEQLFTTWDWGSPGHVGSGDGFYGAAHDWTHANALDLHPDRDTILLGMRGAPVLLEISLADGSVVREYGVGGDIELAPGSEAFQEAHAARWSGPDSILLASTTHETIAVEYAVDEAAGTMTEVWSYGRGEGVLASVQASVYPLPDGNRLVGFGDRPYVREVDPDGRVVWEYRLEGAYVIKSIGFVEDIYALAGEVPP